MSPQPKQKKKAPFMSSSSKYDELYLKRLTPGPQDYQLQLEIEDQLSRRLMLKDARGGFGSSLERFKVEPGATEMGPESYSHDTTLLEQSKGLGSYYFTSRLSRF
jgi:hypothetical protein